MVIKTAVMGKVSGSDGDTLADPTTELEYDLTVIPAVVHTIVRENHGAGNLAFQHSYAYSGGLGQVVLQKVQAEPGLAPKRNGNGDLEFDGGELVFEDTTPNPRWVGNGRVIVDNKGNPVKQYEPFFDSSPAYTDEQELVEWGVTPFIHYDPLGRMVRTDLPDGTFIKVAFTPWEQVTHDANDNVLASDWYAERAALVGGTPHNDGEKYAALHAEPHDSTPTTTLLDNLGRPFLVIADNGLDENDVPQKFETRTKLDIEGNTLEVKDARNNVAETNTFAPGGLQLKTHSVDAGTRLALPNVLGNPLRAWDNRQNVRRWTYDVLNRPTHAYLKHAADPEVLQQRIVYGESLGVSADDTNHLGQVYRVYDSAGVLTSLAYDFKGNLLATERGLAEAYKTTPDWIDLATETDPALIHAAAAPLLEGETFTTSWTYDALSRVRTQTTPDASVTTQTFGLGGMLQSVAVNVRGALTATDIVTNIDYNARGQRLLIEYGNGSSTDYEYDPKNFRVTRIHTERPPTYAGLRTVQDLRYHYDPSGNIAQIRDQAQQSVFFDNAYVDPTQKFRYDPTYRLIEATGREHDALAKPTPAGFTPIAHPQDTQAQRLYKQLYTYDSVGNIREMAHRVIVGNVEQVAWRRGYLYATAGNRLTYTNVPGDNVDDPQSYTGFYDYDEHGNMITIAQIPGGLTWDDDDRLQSTSHVGGGTVYYVYDGAGQRVRKVTVNQSGTTSKQRLYFGGWETYREHKNINTTNDLDLERETLHVHDDHGRVCLIETKTVDAGAPVVTPANIARYQYSNHLGTANLELDEDAEVISYEEFHPYGTSSYRAANNAIEVSAKRYRYTGQERDEETGLAYHGARYYAPWLARWTAADPIGLGDGPNRYAYVSSNPISHRDASGRSKSRFQVERDEARMDAVVAGAIEHGKSHNLSQKEVTALIEERVKAAGLGYQDKKVKQKPKRKEGAGSEKQTQKPKKGDKSTVDNVAQSAKVNDRSKIAVRKEYSEAAKRASQIGIFPKDANSTFSAAEHALGDNHSAYSSVSERPFGAPEFQGERVYIDVDTAVRHGAEYVSHEQLKADVAEHVANKPSEANRAEAWRKRQTGVLGEKESLFKGYIEPGAVHSRATRVLHHAARGLGRFGVAMTVRDVALALEASVREGSLRPITAEVIRQGGAWAGSALGFSLGGVLLGKAVLSSFVALAVPLAVGLVLGMAFYYASDLGADMIYETP
ncbi:RHS repeat-associated core domain-containing protein [Nannocystis sp. ILAH1]|uniref:RHS repeat domain-containing protein n=1 Tax=Nannocystis sp. ILAH1 TaxID=2996789 RepID=UPI00226FF226|nr:RHS repeat-associated core domain-containing protein [Nannocystis sp. ILAH1]MCY0993949.1 RHS repeat-associated core domain-containing protein [Nannocystis sp. ILAH1]